jgi:uncharacterized protein with FMN-binding domain
VRRIALWLASTVSVVALLFGYHTSTSGPDTATGDTPAVISGSATGTTTAARTQGRSGSATVTGDVADTQWGPVQVEVTVAQGAISDVSVLQYPSGNGTDAQINGYALPVLIQETLDAQSASIDMVSGATVTSTGYLQSLQSALDRAGL